MVLKPEPKPRFSAKTEENRNPNTVFSYGVMRPSMTSVHSCRQPNDHRLSEVLSSTHSLTYCVLQQPLCRVRGRCPSPLPWASHRFIITTFSLPSLL